MKTLIATAVIFAGSLLSAVNTGDKTLNTSWKVIRIGSTTDASGLAYSVQLEMIPTPTNRQQGNVTLISATPFTTLTIGEMVPVTFSIPGATPATE